MPWTKSTPKNHRQRVEPKKMHWKQTTHQKETEHSGIKRRGKTNANNLKIVDFRIEGKTRPYNAATGRGNPAGWNSHPTKKKRSQTTSLAMRNFMKKMHGSWVLCFVSYCVMI